MLQAQIFLDEGDRGPVGSLYEDILRYLLRSGLKGATLFRADSGFGARLHLHSPLRLGALDERPLIITFIDEDEKVRSALGYIKPLLRDGLVVLHHVEIG